MYKCENEIVCFVFLRPAEPDQQAGEGKLAHGGRPGPQSGKWCPNGGCAAGHAQIAHPLLHGCSGHNAAGT